MAFAIPEPFESWKLESVTIFNMNTTSEPNKWQCVEHKNVRVDLIKGKSVMISFAPIEKTNHGEIIKPYIFNLTLDSVRFPVQAIFDGPWISIRWGPIPPGWNIRFKMEETSVGMAAKESARLELHFRMLQIKTLTIVRKSVESNVVLQKLEEAMSSENFPELQANVENYLKGTLGSTDRDLAKKVEACLTTERNLIDEFKKVLKPENKDNN